MNVNENNWLKNKHNSCHYDVFITMYLFSINNKFNPFNKDILNEFLETIQKIIIDKNFDLRFALWRKLIKNNIDINSNSDNGLSKMGRIDQLFNIF